MALVAGGATARDAGEIEHVEDIGIGEFVLQGETDDIERTEWQLVFQTGQWCPAGAQGRFHVGPRRIDPFRGNAVHLIEDMIQDRQPEMAHADFIGVGEGQGKTQIDLRQILGDAAEFTAEVAGRFFDLVQAVKSHQGTISSRG